MGQRLTEYEKIDTATRRSLIAGVAALGMLALDDCMPASDNKLRRSQKLGTTFSIKQCEYLNFDQNKTRACLEAVLGLDFDVIRLCSYWDKLEPIDGKLDFSSLDWQLQAVAKTKKVPEVVLSLGLKQPRWPEFHLPAWVQNKYQLPARGDLSSNADLNQRLLEFVTQVVEYTKNNPHISYYQVENEPLKAESVTKGRFLSEEFIRSEVELVRGLARPDQKVLLTNSIDLWPPFSTDDTAAFRKSLKHADVVGINVYPKYPLPFGLYLPPTPFYWRKLQSWQKELMAKGKEPWVSEAQAEPWEDDHNAVHIQKPEYSSSTPQSAKDLVLRLDAMGFSPVLLWGCEHWYYWHTHPTSPHHEWWQTMQDLVQQKP